MTRTGRKTKDQRTQEFLDDCFCQGAKDGDWFKHHGGLSNPTALGGQVPLTDSEAVFQWKLGFKYGAGVSYESAKNL